MAGGDYDYTSGDVYVFLGPPIAGVTMTSAVDGRITRAFTFYTLTSGDVSGDGVDDIAFVADDQLRV